MNNDSESFCAPTHRYLQDFCLAKAQETADCVATAQCHVAWKGESCRLFHLLVLGPLT